MRSALREFVRWLLGGDGSGSGRRSGVVLLAAATTLIVLRTPGLFIHPRLWAEEGSIYLATAFRAPWWKALLTLQKGYFSIVPNVATVVAAQVISLALAPWLTTTVALVFQLVPLSVVTFCPSKFWRTNLQRMLVIVAVLFSWNSGEVWLNTINSQFWCLGTCFFVLLTDHAMVSRRQQRLLCAALFVCGLSGVVSAFLVPLFVVRALAERDSRVTRQALALSAAALLQLIAVGVAFAAGTTGHRLGGGQSQLFLEFVLIRGVLRGFVSSETAWSLMPRKYWVTAEISLVAAFLATKGGWRGLLWFLGGFLLTAVLSLELSVQQTPAPRYFFVPSVILLVLLIANIDPRRGHHGRLQAARCLLATAAFALFLQRAVPRYTSAMADFANPSWPLWSSEIGKWNQDQLYHPQIHPCDRGKCWEVDLTAFR